MKIHASSRTVRLAAVSLLFSVLGVAAAMPACSNSNEAPPGITGGGASPTTSTPGTGGSTATTTTDSTSSTSSDDGGGQIVDAGPPCVPEGGPGDCYSCPPQTDEQILNSCVPAGDQCTHFDNAARLPFWDGGALPAPP